MSDIKQRYIFKLSNDVVVSVIAESKLEALQLMYKRYKVAIEHGSYECFAVTTHLDENGDIIVDPDELP